MDRGQEKPDRKGQTQEEQNADVMEQTVDEYGLQRVYIRQGSQLREWMEMPIELAWMEHQEGRKDDLAERVSRWVGRNDEK